MAIALSGKVDGSLQSSLLSAGGAVSGLEKKLQTLHAAQQKLAKYEGLKSRMSAMNVEYRASRDEAQKLAERMSYIEKPSKEMQNQFAQAQTRSEKLKEKLFGQRRELNALGREMEKAGVSVRNLGKLEGELAAKAERASWAQAGLQKAQAATNAARDRLKWSNMQAEVMSSAGIALALRKPIKDAAELETTMAEIRKVVDFDSPEAFKAMGADLQQLSLRIPMTTKALGEIYASGGQSGIAQKDLLAFTETAAKMGIAFDVSAEQSGEWMAKWRTAFDMSQEDVTVLADQINYLGNNTAATAAEISSVVSRIGPLGKVGNVAAKQIAALGASIVGAGQSQEVAATGAKNFMLALTAGTAATKKQRAAFAELKIDPDKMAEEMMQDPEKVMVGVLERISKVAPSKQAALLTQLFGKESVSAIAPLLSNLDNFKRNLSLVSGTEFSGSMQKEFDALADSAENFMQLAANAAKVTSQNLGKSLLPTVKEVSKNIVALSSRIAEFSEKHPDVFDKIVKSIALLGAVKVGGTVVGILGTMAKFPFLQTYSGIMSIRAAWVAADGSLLTLIKSTKAARMATKLWAGAQWLWTKAMSAGQWLLNAGKIVAYKAASLAAAAAAKAWALAQWVWSQTMAAGQWLLGVGKLIAYKAASLAAAGATKAWAFAQSLWSAAMTAGQWLLGAGKIVAYKMASLAIAGVTKLWTAAQWLLNAALSANPIGLVVVAIGALIAAFVTAYKKVEWFRDGVDAAMTAVKDIFMAGFNKVLALIDKVGDKWNKVLAWFGKSPKIPEPGTRSVPVPAGAAAAVVEAAPHASGGIFSKPHLGVVAENRRTESIVPHDKSGEPIWQTTGAMAGFSMPGDGGAAAPGAGPNITLSLNVNAGGDVDGEELGRKILRVIEPQLPRLLQRYYEQRERLAY